MRQAGGRAGGKARQLVGMLAVLLPAYPPTRLPAQKPAPSHVASPDSTKHVNPVGAAVRSLLIPGWGQAQTGRNVAAAGFVIFEGISIMMTVRAVQEEHYMEATGSENLDSKRQQIQDWGVLLGFNHLFSAAEAYVAAHLMDFPKELKIRAIPRGIRITVPLP